MLLPTFEVTRLLPPAAAIFAVVLVAAWQVTRSGALSVVLAAVKAGIFAVYYGFLFDGRFTFLDDWTYLERGIELHREGVGLGNFWDNLPLLVAVGEGDHFLYYLYNAAAVEWFGAAYFAPVALNVMVSAAVAWMATRLVVQERLIEARLGTLFFCFVLLHPDITAWSTVMNGKDTLVLLLHVTLLTAISLFLRGHRLQALLLASASVAVLLFLRFYVPLMFATALSLAALLQMRGAQRARVLMLSMLILGGLVWNLGLEGLGFFRDVLLANLVNPVTGFFRFLLTPVPFGTDDDFAFLNLPALIHWLLLPLSVLGAWRVYRQRTPFTRLLLLYSLVFVALYAVFGELQGPRHRLQLDFAWAVFQFVGVLAAARTVGGRSAAPTGAAGALEIPR